MTRRRDGSSYQKDRARMEEIKRDFLDAYDRVVEDGFDPTLVRILGRIPYPVNARFAQEVRRELVLSGDLPEPKRGGRKRRVPIEDRNITYYNDREAIADEIEVVRLESSSNCGALPDLSHLRREEMSRRAAAQRLGEYVLAWKPAPDSPTDVDVCKWAIAKFRAAWRSIRDASRKSRESREVLPPVPGDDGDTGLEVADRQGPARGWPLHDDRSYRTA